MPDEDSDSFEDRFFKANANNEYIAGVLADCIRNCMRGIASGDPSSAAYKASQDFLSLIKLLKYAENGVPLMQLFLDAIDEIRPSGTDDIGNQETFAQRYYESSIIIAAQSGIQLVVESSCHDRAAKGRASRRERDFLGSLRDIDEARTEMNKYWESRRDHRRSKSTTSAKKRPGAGTLTGVNKRQRRRRTGNKET